LLARKKKNKKSGVAEDGQTVLYQSKTKCVSEVFEGSDRFLSRTTSTQLLSLFTIIKNKIKKKRAQSKTMFNA
jgi:ubiquinone biosynthesis protein COQ9